jgi:hypothetical protein
MMMLSARQGRVKMNGRVIKSGLLASSHEQVEGAETKTGQPNKIEVNRRSPKEILDVDISDFFNLFTIIVDFIKAEREAFLENLRT